MTPLARNVVVPAWEFPDIPDIQFDGNPQNDWVETANRAVLVLVGGPFTANALEAAGVKTPIRIVPVPTPEKYFRLPRWQSDFRATLDCARMSSMPSTCGRFPSAAGRGRPDNG